MPSGHVLDVPRLRKPKSLSILAPVLDAIYVFLLSQVTTQPERDASNGSPIFQDRVLIFVGTSFFAVFGSAAAAFWLFLQAPYVAPWPAALAVLCGIAVVHLRLTHKPLCAQMTACYGLCLAGIGMYWAFGSNVASASVVNWAFVGPQFDLVGNGSMRSAAAAHILTIVVIVVLTALEVCIRPGIFSPPTNRMTTEWESILNAINLSIPSTISLLRAIFVLSQVRKRAADMEKVCLPWPGLAVAFMSFRCLFCLHTFLYACLPACLPACMHTCLPPCMLAHLLASVHACPRVCIIPACLFFSCLDICLPASL